MAPCMRCDGGDPVENHRTGGDEQESLPPILSTGRWA